MSGAVAIVPAGGSGSRIGARHPKQYLALAGTPLLVLTLRALLGSTAIEGVVLAVPLDRVQMTRRLLARYEVPRVLAVVAGGDERQSSVRRALDAVPAQAELIVVHDAVRPFITRDLVDRVLAAAREHGAATCGIEVRETVKRVSDRAVEATLDRNGLWLTQTPQAFRRSVLREAHDQAQRDGFRGTDDAVLVERLGGRVIMVPGLPENLKITTVQDLGAARLWLGSRATAGRARTAGRAGAARG